MPEHEIKITGRSAAIIAVALLGIIIYRLATLNDNLTDEDLLQEVTLLLQTEYLPDQVSALEAAMESGDQAAINAVANSVISSQLNIQSINASYPIFSFDSNKEVIIKVSYSVDSDSGSLQSGTKYYRFKHGTLTDSWRYEREASKLSYYLNFI